MRLSFIIFFLALAYGAQGQTFWNLKTDKEGIKVYNHKDDTSRFSEIKVEAFLDGHLSDLAGILLDVSHHQDWSYATKLGKILKNVAPSEVLFYKEIGTPPPLSNRDFVGRLTITQDPISKVMTVKVEAVKGLIPEKDGLVRVPVTVENWVVTPVSKDKLKVEYYLKVDPGGSVSAFLVNMFATKAPFETFRNLKAEMIKRKGRVVRFSFLVD